MHIIRSFSIPCSLPMPYCHLDYIAIISRILKTLGLVSFNIVLYQHEVLLYVILSRVCTHLRKMCMRIILYLFIKGLNEFIHDYIYANLCLST